MRPCLITIVNMMPQCGASLTDSSRHSLLTQVTYDSSHFRGIYTGDKTLHVCRYRQWWRFGKIGEFLLKLQCSAKSLDPHHVCVRTFTDNSNVVIHDCNMFTIQATVVMPSVVRPNVVAPRFIFLHLITH